MAGKSKRKKALAARLAVSVSRFYPELRDTFICPTCLLSFQLSSPSQISEAHIIPQAAGGRQSTIICRDCNSAFGSAQDKWFGEYVRILKADHRTWFATRLQEGHYEIDGEKVGGEYRIAEDGGLEFYIWTDHTSPAALARLNEKAKLGLSKITIPLPLHKNRGLIDIGFLTAAYLLWYRQMGYSWALQEHLGPIRDHIRNPHDPLDVPCFVYRKELFDHPWIGVGTVDGELVLLAGLANCVVLLPAFDQPDLYAKLASQPRVVGDYAELRFHDHHNFDGPLGLMVGDRILVAPDVLFTDGPGGAFLFYPPQGGAPRILYPTTEEEVQRGRREKKTVHVKARHRFILPTEMPGRPKRGPQS